MWSVWSEPVQVYLGTGLVLVKRQGAPLWCLEPPTTLPLADALWQVDHELARGTRRPWRLHVHLSSALCRPVAFMVPPSVRRQEELAMAQAHAVHAWEMPSDFATEIVCSLDAKNRGLAATMLMGTHQVIERWAMGHEGRLASLQPLWALATSAKACRGHHINSVAVLEPDGLTVLNLKQQRAVRAQSWQGTHAPAEASAHLTAMTSPKQEPARSKGVLLAFSREPGQASWPGAPSTWAPHWSLLP